eukprot:CAMPEP_0204512772 /NCGR_PEP_ID=MMETSP0661-20131031/1135_1 /ASSEMBLY_ACC=CAM_ASM_000606 /TAXON_ID=109239 /ORGANISM="Alexandrium margalefi, Strain AMGDE01CS-322" /LENGTH=119 /DNA_ID=CAMNT_0051517901 /DNA_START=27 /DNA_END=382 /DNA_ORIENTATION=-
MAEVASRCGTSGPGHHCITASTTPIRACACCRPAMATTSEVGEKLLWLTGVNLYQPGHALKLKPRSFEKRPSSKGNGDTGGCNAPMSDMRVSPDMSLRQRSLSVAIPLAGRPLFKASRL